MNKDTHKKVHQDLHKSLCELAIDYINHTNKLLYQSTIKDLIDWSEEQTKNPNDLTMEEWSY